MASVRPADQPVTVPPADERALAQLAAEGFGDLFHERQHRACALVERYALDLACTIARALDLPARLVTPQRPEALMTACGFVPAFAAPLRWLLDVLAMRGVLAVGPDGYRQAAALPAVALDAVRAAGLAADPSYEPAYALLDEAAALYPRVARGEVVAERALFLRARLWQAYFSNANRYYALSNRVVARAAAARLADAGGGAVLEVGAGLGSATEALFEALAARGATALVERYLLTEPVPFFRRRAEQALAARWPEAPIVSATLDLNGPWAEQDGVTAGAFALVWGVNVFHLARDLDAVLAAARAALRPDGWLVVGEGLRPTPLEPVAAELPFRLLASFADVALDPERRPTPGFLTAAAWRAALERAGLAAVHFVPDAERLQAFCPVFLAAAACGRRRAT